MSLLFSPRSVTACPEATEADAKHSIDMTTDTGTSDPVTLPQLKLLSLLSIGQGTR